MQKFITIKTKEDMKHLEEGKVYMTTNYDLIGWMDVNREIKKMRVERLKKSIRQKDMLSSNPIKINKNFEVYDGQKRLTAARELDRPIYFTYHPEADNDDMRLLNIYVDPWMTVDFLNYYIKLGKQDYIRVKEFADEYRLSIPIAIQLLGNKDIGTGGFESWQEIRTRFNDGYFIVVDDERAQRLASVISEIRDYSPDFAWRHRDCVRAVAQLVDKVDPKLLTNSLKKYNQTITRRYSVSDYLKEFENIISAGGKQVQLR